MRFRPGNGVVFFFSTILLLYVSAGVSRSYCQEFVMGKVLSVDSKGKEIKVTPLVSTRKPDSGIAGGSILVRSQVALPACVTIGEKIRIWGERLPHDINTFIATDIRGCRGGGCSDPTGVRSRLSRRRKRNQNPCNDTAPTVQSMGCRGRSRGHGGR